MEVGLNSPTFGKKCHNSLSAQICSLNIVLCGNILTEYFQHFSLVQFIKSMVNNTCFKWTYKELFVFFLKLTVHTTQWCFYLVEFPCFVFFTVKTLTSIGSKITLFYCLYAVHVSLFKDTWSDTTQINALLSPLVLGKAAMSDFKVVVRNKLSTS